MDEQGDTALMYATFKVHEDIVRALIKAGADLDLKNKQGDTAVIAAAFEGHEDI